MTFAYDALARRVSKTYLDRTTRWIWDGNVPLHEWVEPPAAPDLVPAAPADGVEADEIAARHRAAALNERPAQGPPPAPGPELGTREAPITWLFDPESFAPTGKLVGASRYAITTDHLGTPTAMYDAAGAEVWSATIDTYGDLRDVQGDRAACPFRWPGQYEDPETGLYYNRWRYYDPQAGGYCSSQSGQPGGRLPTVCLYLGSSHLVRRFRSESLHKAKAPRILVRKRQRGRVRRCGGVRAEGGRRDLGDDGARQLLGKALDKPRLARGEAGVGACLEVVRKGGRRRRACVC